MTAFSCHEHHVWAFEVGDVIRYSGPDGLAQYTVLDRADDAYGQPCYRATGEANGVPVADDWLLAEVVDKYYAKVGAAEVAVP